MRPTLALVLGSGFQRATESLRIAAELSYAEIPGFPVANVPGHAGQLLLGHLGPTPVLVLNGRAHYYEGWSVQQVTFPIRVLAEFGIRDLLLTNAAGGINRKFRPGDFMSLADHLNLLPEHPLRGPVPAGRERFVDLSQVYDPRLGRWLQTAARRANARLHRGVYAAVAGPSYETPAEIRALARLGADAVGMSTVPEAIVARQCGLAVAGLSCITNLAAGRSGRPLSHAEVLAAGAAAHAAATEMLRHFANIYHHAATR